MNKTEKITIINQALKDVGHSVERYGKSPWYNVLKIGFLSAFSMLLDGTIILSETDTPKKIVRTYLINMYEIFAYEDEEGNIYIFATAYFAYYGYIDKNYNIHRYLEFDNLLGIYIDEKYLLKCIKKMKKNKIKRLINYIKKVLLKPQKMIFLCNKNIGHHIWNEQPIIDYLEKNNLLKYIDKLAYSIDYFGLNQYFSKKNLKSINCSHKKNWCTNNLLIHFSTTTYSQETSNRLKQFAVENVKQKQNNDVKILLHQRLTLRNWKQQTEGLSSIINELSNKYDNISFFIDGYSIPMSGNNKNSYMHINDDIKYYKEWTQNLSEKAKNKVTSIIGQNCLEKVVYYNNCNLLVMSYGSPEHINWITNKPIILYGPLNARNLSIELNSKHMLKDFSINSTLLEQNLIKEYPDLSYDLDYKYLLSVIEEQLKVQNII